MTAVGATAVGITAVRNNLKFWTIITLDLPSFADDPCLYIVDLPALLLSHYLECWHYEISIHSGNVPPLAMHNELSGYCRQQVKPIWECKIRNVCVSPF